MRATVFGSALLVSLLFVACSDDDSGFQPVKKVSEGSGTVLAYVVWDGQGLPDHRVQIVELGLEAKTDADGYASFDVPPGRYTLRVYDINSGGPPLLYVDTDVSVQKDETTRVNIVDCLPCV